MMTKTPDATAGIEGGCPLNGNCLIDNVIYKASVLHGQNMYAK